MSVLWYFGETWAASQNHISPLAVFQMIACGGYVASLCDHVLSVDILNRCNTIIVKSLLRSKRLRWLGHVFRMSNDRLPKKLLVGQVTGQRLRDYPRSSFNDVVLRDCHTSTSTDHSGMLRIECSGKTGLALHVPSSHELECVSISTIVMRENLSCFCPH